MRRWFCLEQGQPLSWLHQTYCFPKDGWELWAPSAFPWVVNPTWDVLADNSIYSILSLSLCFVCCVYLTASLKVIGPSQPLLVRVGEDIKLTCYLSPKANAQSMEVRWVRSHRYPAVYVYVDGDHVSKEQMAEYRGRTVLVTDALHEGRLTLHIHNASTSDDGQYRCLFEKDGVYQESSLDLKVVGKDFRYIFWILLLWHVSSGKSSWHLTPFIHQIYIKPSDVQ